ncbi:MAG: DeoR/GlpR transcriptional regulator [Spirochaetales bacterium]|nr:MAG: DeoR/GlpR transcriptional regulator [Spirochaetales bacterium]
MTMQLSERESKILQLLTEDSSLSLTDLGRELSVSVVTARSDLDSLADKGFIIRTRGGGIPAFHPSIRDRQKQRVDEKNRIAREAASLIENGDTIMIEAGTTTALIAKYLLGRRDITIVSNSALIIPYARSNPSLILISVGGEFKPPTESFVGPLSLRELEQYHVRTAFVGTDGFAEDFGLTTHLTEGAEIVKKMSEQAERTVLVADSSKYGRAGFVRVLPLSRINILITDNNLDPGIYERLQSPEFSIRLV